jgi:high-affinity Fe2+/Pb2+ permease
MGSAMEHIMKKLSLSGLMLGALAGMAVALMLGKWIFWLALGLVIGIFIGSASARIGRRRSMDFRVNT